MSVREFHSSAPRVAAILRLLRLSAVTSAVTAFGLVPAVASADSCPNAPFRAGPSASLPDCRAYELVSPADTNNYDILFGDDAATAAGTAVTYDSPGVFANNPGGAAFNRYVSTRGGSGWSTQGISLLGAPNTAAFNFDAYQGFTADLSRGVILAGDPPLDGATPGTANLYRRSADGSLQLITPGEPAPSNGPYSGGVAPIFAGGSADYSVLAFQDPNALTGVPGARNENVYEWAGGPKPILVTNGGVVGSGATEGGGGTTASRAVSADGSRIFWTRGFAPGSIYLFAGGATSMDIPKGTTSPTTVSLATANNVALTSGQEVTVGGQVFTLNANASSGATSLSGSFATSPTTTDIPSGSSVSIKITTPECSGCTESAGGTYWTASTDGSKAFFTSTDRLSDSTASPQGTLGDLYMYDANGGTLTDLAPGADVQGVIGASDDGSYVYFVANGVLASGAAPGTCDGSGGAGATCNLYLWHGGTTTFIATVDDADAGSSFFGGDWALMPPVPRALRAQVSADGLHLLYTSTAPVATLSAALSTSAAITSLPVNALAKALSSGAQVTLTSGTNTQTWTLSAPAAQGATSLTVNSQTPNFAYPSGQVVTLAHSEVYLYDASPAKLTCVSCNPLGAAQGDAVLASVPPLQTGPANGMQLATANNMSSDSTRVFFETNDALVQQDTNGTDDVYEWEASPCSGDAVTQGYAVMQDGDCISLISSGRSPDPSWFENATPSGHDVFFLTRDPLVAQDTAGNQALYDARVGGGFPAPTTLTPCSSGDACHGPATPTPGAPTAATITFAGPGNATSGFVTRPTVKVLQRVVHGTSFFERVTVPASGVITVRGRWLRTVRLAVPRPGTYSLRVALASQGRRALARRRRLRVNVSTGYQTNGAQFSPTTVSVTFARRRR